MKSPKILLALAIGGVLAVFAAGFLAGGAYASTRAVQSENKASLVYLAAIHDALGRQDYSQAAHFTNAAVDSQVAVLREWADSPWLLRTWYARPWTQGQQAAFTGSSLLVTRDAYTAQPELLRAETRRFLKLPH